MFLLSGLFVFKDEKNKCIYRQMFTRPLGSSIDNSVSNQTKMAGDKSWAQNASWTPWPHFVAKWVSDFPSYSQINGSSLLQPKKKHRNCLSQNLVLARTLQLNLAVFFPF